MSWVIRGYASLENMILIKCRYKLPLTAKKTVSDEKGVSSPGKVTEQ